MLKNQKGQALLIVVLVIVIALLVALGLISRSVISLKTTQDQADSQKALAAAEAGLERVLADPNIQAGQTITGTLGTGASYSTSVTQGGGTDLFLLHGTFSSLDKNEYVYLWPSKVTDSDTNLYGGDAWNGSTNIYWGADPNTACNNAALEISVISGKHPLDTSNLVLTKYAYDPCDTTRAGATGNNFTSISKSAPANQKAIDNNTLYYHAIIPPSVSDSIYLIAITPLYVNDNFIAVQSDTSIPPQGKTAVSTGTIGQLERKETQFANLHQIPPELFPFAIFSP